MCLVFLVFYPIILCTVSLAFEIGSLFIDVKIRLSNYREKYFYINALVDTGVSERVE
jgi:hypothetical protein